MRDDSDGDGGSIDGGWSLRVETTIAEGSFTDNPLTTGTFVKRIHIVELRDAVNAARAAKSLAAFSFTDPTVTAGSTPIKAAHITELRTALGQAYAAAGQPLPTYTDSTITAGTTVVKAVHVRELRAAVANLP